jgi:hypothetical protein
MVVSVLLTVAHKKYQYMKKFLKIAVFALFISVAFGGVAFANHLWGGYHWARTSNPFTLKIADNVSGPWDSVLATASVDWSQSSVLDTTIVPGTSNPKNCKATAGQVNVCNSRYGNTQWLGIASVWVSGGHIVQGTVKLNDTYFNTAQYNTTAWRNLVTCQEIGHTIGLDHQDENFSNANLGTCMDYTNQPEPNQHPNAHDYEQLESLYAHADSGTTLGQLAASALARSVSGEEHAEWGRAIRLDANGKPSVYAKDLGGKDMVFTFVTWAE